MSALRLRLSPRALSSCRSSFGPAPARSFQTSRIAAVGKESALHEDQPSRTAKIEQQKQDQLKDAKANQGKWQDELASDSESIVKADRGEVKDAKSTISELQQETAKLAEKEKKEGKK